MEGEPIRITDLTELHSRLYQLLCTVDDICEKESLRYFLDSGTEIGAVRDRNFIPWDDDMDIKVLAEDLENFVRVMKRCLPPYLHIIGPDAFHPGFYDFNYRIYDDRYVLRDADDESAYYKDLDRYLGTDIFVITHAPTTRFGQSLYLFGIKLLYGLSMAHRFHTKSAKYTTLQKIEVGILRGLGKLLPASWLNKCFWKHVTKYQSRETGWRFPCNFPIPELNRKPFIPAHVYSETVRFPLKERSFPVPSGYDEELTILYGSYMVPDRDPEKYKVHLQQADE